LRNELADYGNLITPTENDERRAWQAYANGDAAAAGIVDHVSFAVMERLGLTEAFTNDFHFEAAGFRRLF
jgi:predicted nucleic acid-binding protein